MISSPRRSIAASTRCLSSSLVMSPSPSSRCVAEVPYRRTSPVVTRRGALTPRGRGLAKMSIWLYKHREEAGDMATLTRPATLSIETFRAPGEGCLGYLVVDEPSRTALAIDPRLDQVGAFQETLAARGVRLTHVLDTHTHADHLSGVRMLARRTGATVMAHAASKLAGTVERVTGGTTFELGTSPVSVLDAPGHTPDSLAVLVDGHLFTGDALFARGAGRTDLMGGSASDLYDTFRRFEALPDATVVHPGHDYVGQATTTIGEEKHQNPLLRERDRAALVARLAVKGAPPANMSAVLRHNLGESESPTVAPRDLAPLRDAGP
ncbi:MAG: hypothetical protein DMD81_10500, partial [Candidatus Rokuibacteriota bacterium]